MVTYGFRYNTRALMRTAICGRLAAIGFAVALWIGVTHSATASEVVASEREAFLRAIAEVETGGNPRAIGSQGERGLFQFTRTTWRMHSKRAFGDAHIPHVSFDVAHKHYNWLHEGLIRNGRRPTPYLIAAAWNAGLSRVVSGRVPSSSRDYATRVINIVSVTKPSIPVAIPIQPAILIASDR